jgi:hypothetical protein
VRARDPQTWRLMIANACKMPLVIASVNGDRLDGRHVLVRDSRRTAMKHCCVAALCRLRRPVGCSSENA